jgi:hypothetical protein
MNNFMKNNQQIFKGWVGAVGMICLLALSLSSCIKNNNNDTTDTTPAALISVINLSPDSQSLDFYLDNNKANTYPIPFASGLDYIRAYTGVRTSTFVAAGTQTKIKSDTMTLAANKAYSLFLGNLVAKPDYVLLKDTLDQPAAGMAKVRFVHMGSDAPAVDFAIKGGNVLATSKAYKGFSGFKSVTGETKYTFEIRQAGTATVLASLSDVTLHAGYIYTIWLQGLTAATDQTKLAANIQLNAYY